VEDLLQAIQKHFSSLASIHKQKIIVHKLQFCARLDESGVLQKQENVTVSSRKYRRAKSLVNFTSRQIMEYKNLG
jgi:predicted metallopeptidase